ncbi:MAG: DUF4116 domain-containing protein [Deltaproteobacteria bacterium]|nr:DUF4116 domain-containing protein [Deltaproteobacteria bacterium]
MGLEICQAAVRRSGQALEYVPEKFKTREVCLAAGRQNGSALEHVPREFRNQAEFLPAVR